MVAVKLFVSFSLMVVIGLALLYLYWSIKSHDPTREALLISLMVIITALIVIAGLLLTL